MSTHFPIYILFRIVASRDIQYVILALGTSQCLNEGR